jgi:hypothetical protein
MKIIHYETQTDKPYVVGNPDADLPLTASLISYRHNVSSSLARLIHREHYGGGE